MMAMAAGEKAEEAGMMAMTADEKAAAAEENQDT